MGSDGRKQRVFDRLRRPRDVDGFFIRPTSGMLVQKTGGSYLRGRVHRFGIIESFWLRRRDRVRRRRCALPRRHRPAADIVGKAGNGPSGCSFDHATVTICHSERRFEMCLNLPARGGARARTFIVSPAIFSGDTGFVTRDFRVKPGATVIGTRGTSTGVDRCRPFAQRLFRVPPTSAGGARRDTFGANKGGAVTRGRTSIPRFAEVAGVG